MGEGGIRERQFLQLFFAHRGEVPSCEFRGVTWNETMVRWQGHISYNGCQFELECFEQAEAAATAYDVAARRLYGKNAVTNFDVTGEAVKTIGSTMWIEQCGPTIVDRASMFRRRYLQSNSVLRPEEVVRAAVHAENANRMYMLSDYLLKPIEEVALLLELPATTVHQVALTAGIYAREWPYERLAELQESIAEFDDVSLSRWGNTMSCLSTPANFAPINTQCAGGSNVTSTFDF